MTLFCCCTTHPPPTHKNFPQQPDLQLSSNFHSRLTWPRLNDFSFKILFRIVTKSSLTLFNLSLPLLKDILILLENYFRPSSATHGCSIILSFLHVNSSQLSSADVSHSCSAVEISCLACSYYSAVVCRSCVLCVL